MANIINQNGQVKVGFRTPSSGGGGNTPSYLLDTYSGAAAAYSLRKLRNDYTGSAITVRRSSDNTSTNIGFNADGTLDTTALTSFVGSNNISLYSEEFDNVNWSKYITTVTSNQTTAPDGTMTADLLAEASANNYHTLYNATVLSFAVGTSWNVSVYVKKGPGTSAPNTIILGFPSPTTNTFPHPCVLFNISSGTVLDSSNVSNDANFGSSIVDAGNGWWRCSVWGTVTGAGNRYQHGVIRFNNNLNTINGATYAGNAQSNIYIWGWQFQKALNNTSVLTTQSYTKTTATANSGNGFVSTWFDQGGGGKDAIQATAANQPQIVSNGNVITLNNKPSLSFNGSTFMNTTQNVLSVGNGGYSVFGLGRPQGTPNCLFYIGSSTGNNGVGLNNNNGIPRHYWFANDYDSNQTFGNTNSIFTVSFDGVKRYTTINNVNTSSNSSGKNTTNPTLSIGRLPGYSQNLVGYESELIIYDSNKESIRTNITNDINTFYSIY